MDVILSEVMRRMDVELKAGQAATPGALDMW